jgi:hypothetical protein
MNAGLAGVEAKAAQFVDRASDCVTDQGRLTPKCSFNPHLGKSFRWLVAGLVRSCRVDRFSPRGMWQRDGAGHAEVGAG